MQLLLAGAVLALSAGQASAQETTSYTYDELGRLVTVTHSGSVNNGVQTAYTLDAADNRTQVTTTGASH